MGYQRGDNRYGADRGREQGRGRYGDHGRDRWSRDDDDRSFFERASDEVRSWFHDDDDDYGRRSERERGWGAEHRDRGWGDRGQDRWRETGSDWREGRSGSGSRGYGYRGSADAQDSWGGSGFGGDYDRGRRFDRIDAGSTGTHGAHPMSSPVGGAYGSSYGTPAAGYGSSARSAQAYREGGAGGVHDPHYSEWRNRQIEALDRDYEDYRRENQSRFEQEFGGWREKRQGQRQALGRASEGMEVVGSDGQHVGTVDKVRADRIILTKSDPNAGGHHHSIPCGWVDKVEDKVTINKTLEEATRQWRDEETSRALFERDDQGSDGPHALDRAFKGTY